MFEILMMMMTNIFRARRHDNLDMPRYGRVVVPVKYAPSEIRSRRADKMNIAAFFIILIRFSALTFKPNKISRIVFNNL